MSNCGSNCGSLRGNLCALPLSQYALPIPTPAVVVPIFTLQVGPA
jgi:hypothetical protein